ncbi:DUF642 domain-containing protein [Candidatus Campbellbacteria bacterium]|nr:MAG: DUF642 domain-containing protein [Candidatus Campbellbacteria bacterium]
MNFITNASYKTYRGIGLTFMAALLIVGVFSFNALNANALVAPLCEPNNPDIIYSDSDTQVEGGGSAVAVTPHSVWLSTVSIPGATWVWDADKTPANDTGSNPAGTLTFTRTFTITDTPTGATLDITTDNSYVATINGHAIGSDGTWQSVESYVIPAGDLLSGTNTLTIVATNDGPDGPGNPAGLLYKLTVNSEVCPPDLDFGDAPDPGHSYPTRLVSDGARHVIVPGVYLGTLIDAETDVVPGSDALEDDNFGIDDEDGVLITSSPVACPTNHGCILVTGTTATMEVTASVAGYIDAWVDWSTSGVFEPTDRIFNNQPVVAGLNTLTFAVPIDGNASNYVESFLRVRFHTTDGALLPSGLASDGEVEDYQIAIRNWCEPGQEPGTDPGYPYSCIPVQACRVDVVSAVGDQGVGNGNAVAAWIHSGWTTALNSVATWIWDSYQIQNLAVDESKTFTKDFYVDGPVNDATLNLAADNRYWVTINGNPIISNTGEFNYGAVTGPTDVTTNVVSGWNTIEFKIENIANGELNPEINPAAGIYQLVVNGREEGVCEQPPADDTTLTVIKMTNPDGSTQPFDFTLDSEAFATLQDNDDGSGAIPVATGTHLLAEIGLPDWGLTGWECRNDAEQLVGTDMGESGIELDFSHGDDITCTFTNTKDEAPFCEGNLIKNGSFEAPIVTDNGGDWQLFANLTPGLEWIAKLVDTETDAPLEIQAGYSGWVAQNGDQYAELDSTAPTTISQNVVTTPGQAYKLTYWRATRPGTLPENNAVWVTQNGEQIDSNVFGVTSSNPDWYMSPEVTFIATSSLTNLAFKDIGSSADSLGTFIDSVCLVPTKNPEPKTCSLDVVSDTTNVVVETGLNAVATWVHPGWTTSIPGATWIWKSLNVENPTSDEIYTFTKYFNWTDTTKLVSANLDLATDNSYRVWVNDQGVSTSTDENNFSAADSYDVKSLLVNGTNKITVEVKNWALGGSTAETNPAGALYKLTLTGEDGSCTPDPLPQCSDGIDNDEDGFTDWPSDTTCGGPSDNDEQGGGGDEQRGTIIIKKEVTDGSDSDVNFFFNATWLGEEGTFSLTGGDEKSYVLAPGEYGVDEAQKLGWTLTNESCVSDNPTPTKVFSEIQTQITSDITLHDGEVVTCTFINDQDKKNNGDDDGGGQSSGGGGRSHRNRSSSTGEVLGEQVLGDQVALAPVGAPNTGFGGLKMCFY